MAQDNEGQRPQGTPPSFIPAGSRRRGTASAAPASPASPASPAASAASSAAPAAQAAPASPSVSPSMAPSPASLPASTASASDTASPIPPSFTPPVRRRTEPTRAASPAARSTASHADRFPTGSSPISRGTSVQTAKPTAPSVPPASDRVANQNPNGAAAPMSFAPSSSRSARTSRGTNGTSPRVSRPAAQPAPYRGSPPCLQADRTARPPPPCRAGAVAPSASSPLRCSCCWAHWPSPCSADGTG